MTNAEKFEEMFGVRPDIETMVLDCPTILQSECQYKEDEDMFCHCEKWWDEEYKEKPMIDIIPPEEEPSEIEQAKDELWGKLHPEAFYLKEISKTLKEILREMRKRKV